MTTKAKQSAAEKARAAGEPVPVSEASDGGDSRLTKGYKDAPDKPDKTTKAQIEVLEGE